MARTYAGILGPLAFLTSLAHGMIAHGGTHSVLWTAWCCLLAFSAAGWVIGWIAQRTIEESVHGRIAAELNGGKGETPPAGNPGAAG